MYKVLYQGSRAKQFRRFNSYDEARNAVRRYLRNWFGPFKNNPAIQDFGFSIVKAK